MVTAQAIINQSLAYLGLNYVFGAKGQKGHMPTALDCSGLTKLVCDELGVTFPHGAQAQYDFCRKHATLCPVETAKWKRGTLLFMAEPTGRIHHVGFSDGQGSTIEARGKAFNTVGKGVWRWAWRKGWTHAAYIPSVNYLNNT